MIKEKIKRRSALLYLIAGWFLLLPAAGLMAQEDIEEQLYRRDSLIERIGKENVDTSYTYEWNQDSSRWDLFGRDLEFYRANQNLVAVLEQKWYPQKFTFQNHKRTIKSYDESGNVVESLRQSWDTTRHEWVNLRLKTITYDQQGNKSEVLHQQWRRAVGRWISTTRYLIEYNRQGEKSNIVIRSYQPETDSWSNYQRYLFRYDEGFGPPDEALVQHWNKRQKEWQKQGLYSMSYNMRGKKTVESRATWNESLSEWINGLRYEFSYKKDLKTDQILKRWDYGTKRWYNATRKRFKYNDKDELKEELTYRWNSEMDQWELKNRLLYSQKKPEIPTRKDEKGGQTSDSS